MPAEDETTRKSILRLRFPDGDVEILWTADEVPVGVLVRSRGTLWVVKRSDDGVVDLAPAPPEVQAQHGPMVKPSPLGKTRFSRDDHRRLTMAKRESRLHVS